MEDFKNTAAISEEIYSKIFKKDKLNIVYSEPGRGAGFICKSIINHLALKERFQVIEAIDTELVNSTLRDLCDDVYALKRLKERTGHELEKPLLFYIDITDINNIKSIDNIKRLYDTNIIQSLNIWILFKTVKKFLFEDKANKNTINFSAIKVVNGNSYIKTFPEINWTKLFINNNSDFCIDNSVEALLDENIPLCVNIEHCRNIIADACGYLHDTKIITNLQKCNSYLIKVIKKLKENETTCNLKTKMNSIEINQTEKVGN